MDFKATLIDQMSGPAAAGAGAVDRLAASSEQASGALSDVGASGGRSLTQLAGISARTAAQINADLTEETRRLSRLQAAFRNLNKGNAVDIETAGKLRLAIQESSARVSGLTTDLVQAGGAGETFSKGAKEAQADGSKMAAVAAVAAVAVATVGAAALSAGRDLLLFGTRAALGWQGMGRLQAASLRLDRNLKSLFRGIDASPILRISERVVEFFSRQSIAGQALSGVFERSFGALFRLLERAEPLAESFALGLIYGALRIENAYLRGRLALVPWTNELRKLLGQVNAGRAVFTAAAGTVLVLAGTMAIAAAPPLLLAAGLVYLGAKVYALLEALGITRPVLIGVAIAAGLVALPFVLVGVAAAAVAVGLGLLVEGIIRAVNWFRSLIGIGGQAETAVTGIGDKIAAVTSKLPGGEGAKNSGKNIGDGLIQGMLAQIPGVRSAGAELARAAEEGVNATAKIASPAKLFMEKGMYMGEGAALGIEASAPLVQDAAERALVPSLLVGDGGGAAGAIPGPAGGGGISVSLAIDKFIMGAGQSPEGVQEGLESVLRRAAQAIFGEASIELGLESS